MTLTPTQIRYMLALMGEETMPLGKPGGDFSALDALALRDRLKAELSDEWVMRLGVYPPSWIGRNVDKLEPVFNVMNDWASAGLIIKASGRVVRPGDTITRTELEAV